MTELPPEAAALIEQARRAHGPKQADRDRVLTGLHASLGIGAASALAAASASATASAAESAALTNAAGTGKALLGWKSALLTWKAGKVMLATVALGGAIGVGAVSRGPHAPEEVARRAVTPAQHAPARPAAFAHRPLADAEEPKVPAQEALAQVPASAPAVTTTQPLTIAQPARPTAQPAAEVATRMPLAEPAVRVEAEAQSSTTIARSSTRRRAAARASERHVVSKTVSAKPLLSSPVVAAAVEEATSPAAPEPAQPSATASEQIAATPKVDSELVLIRRAVTSLRDRDSEQALAVLAEHATRYPSGAFATERRGLRIVALCAAGLVDQGQREQAAFLQEAGSSPIAERVRRACAEDGQ